MTIEIHEPELEAILQQKMASGRFASMEDVLLHALRPSGLSAEIVPVPANDLNAIFAEVRGLADDLDFSRIPSSDRPVDL